MLILDTEGKNTGGLRVFDYKTCQLISARKVETSSEESILDRDGPFLLLYCIGCGSKNYLNIQVASGGCTDLDEYFWPPTVNASQLECRNTA